MANDSVYCLCCPRPVKAGSRQKAILKQICWYQDRQQAIDDWLQHGGKPGGWGVWLLGVTPNCCCFTAVGVPEGHETEWAEIVYDFMHSLPLSFRWAFLADACRIAMTGNFPDEEHVDLSK